MSWALTVVATLAALVLGRRLVRARELTARASHELRGPLTAAQLALEAMALPPERAGALEAQLVRARLALDDLVAAPRGAQVPDRLEPVVVADFVAELVAAWRPVAAASGAELRADTGAGAGLLLADRTRLAQAAGNLLANALEHGRSPVELRVRAADGVLRLEVRDGGPGLPAPVAALARRPRGGGRGRGLAIATGIAERHGGRLVAAPSPRGAALALELPLLAGHAVAVGESL